MDEPGASRQDGQAGETRPTGQNREAGRESRKEQGMSGEAFSGWRGAGGTASAGQGEPGLRIAGLRRTRPFADGPAPAGPSPRDGWARIRQDGQGRDGQEPDGGARLPEELRALGRGLRMPPLDAETMVERVLTGLLREPIPDRADPEDPRA